MKNVKSKKILTLIIVLSISFIIYFFIPLLLKKVSFLNHITIKYYLEQLQSTILFLPIILLIYFIGPIRKFLDYQNYLLRIREKEFLIGIIILSIFLTTLISWKCYDHLPQSDDVAAYKQAQIFLTNNRWVPSHIYPEFFDGCGMVNNRGRYFSITAPGHSFFLLIGLLIGIPWIICPLMGTFLLLILYFLLKRLFSSLTARTGTLFLMLSPSFLFFSASSLNQNSSALFSLLSLFLITLALYNPLRLNIIFIYFLAGVSIGIAFLSRPTAPLVFFFGIIVFSFIMTKKKILPSKIIIFFILGFLPFLVFQAYDNFALTGNIFHYGYFLLEPKGLGVTGFGINIGEPTFGIQGHNLLKALINLFYNITVFSLHLFGWPLLSLVLAILWKPKIPFEWLILGILIFMTIFMSFWWFHGISPIGTLYYYEMIPLLILLTVRKIETLKPNIRVIITLLFLIDICVYIPKGTKIFEFWGSNNNCYNEIKKQNIHNAIVFIKDPEVPSDFSIQSGSEEIRTVRRYNYSSVSFRNAAEISKGDIVYARDLGEDKNLKLKKLYSNRNAYLFEYSGDNSKYRVVHYQ